MTDCNFVYVPSVSTISSFVRSGKHEKWKNKNFINKWINAFSNVGCVMKRTCPASGCFCKKINVKTATSKWMATPRQSKNAREKPNKNNNMTFDECVVNFQSMEFGRALIEYTNNWHTENCCRWKINTNDGTKIESKSMNCFSVENSAFNSRGDNSQQFKHTHTHANW